MRPFVYKLNFVSHDIVEMRKFFEYSSFFCDSEAIKEGIDSVLFQWCRVLEYTVDALLREKRRKKQWQRSVPASRVFFLPIFGFFTNREDKSSYLLPGYP